MPLPPRPPRPRRTLIIWIAATSVVVVALTTIVVFVLLPRTKTATADWAGGTLEVTAFDLGVTIDDAPFSPEAADAMADLVPTDYLSLSPLEITANGAVPESGITLELTLPGKIPESGILTFAYFDEEISSWVPEKTTIGRDRRTITAVVDHLSIWTVFTSAAEDMANALGGIVQDVGDALAEAWDRGAKQLFLFSHELLGNSADNPECTGEVPAWLKEATTTDNVDVDLGIGGEDNGIAGVLLCVGSAPDDPGLLQVKAAANRGYGFPVVFGDGVTPHTAGPSGMDESIVTALQAATSVFVDSASLQPPALDRFVFATQEYTATFTEENVRDAGIGRIVSFDLPSLPQVLLSSALKIALDEFEPGNEAIAAIFSVLSMVRDCEMGDLDTGFSVRDLPAWLTSCASSLDAEKIADAMDAVAKDLVKEPADAAKLSKNASLVRTVASKARFLLIFSVAQTIIDYIGDFITDNVTEYPSWFVQVIVAPLPPAIDSMHGTYTWRGDGDDFSTMTFSAEGILLTDCRACGLVGSPVKAVSTWNGACYDVVTTLSFDWGDGTEQYDDETWMVCPKGFGGPGDDGFDRLGQPFRGAPPSQWYVRN